MVGEEVDLTFPVEHLGAGPDALAKILKGSPMLKRLQEAQRPAVIVGPGVLNRPDSAAVLQQVPPLDLHFLARSLIIRLQAQPLVG